VVQRGLVGGLTAVVFAIAVGVSYMVGHHFATSLGDGCVRDYPDEQPTDVCATNNVVVLNDMRVTVGQFKEVNGLLNKELRSAVSLVNVAGENRDYSDVNFKVQSPSGDVSMMSAGATGTDVGLGTLIAGGRRSATICTDNKGERGLFVVIYQPDVLKPDRGIWLFNV
jgi:hypothetical protein